MQLKNGKKLSGGPMVKNLPANAGDTGSILGTGGFHLSGATKRMLHSYWSPQPELYEKRSPQWEAHTPQPEAALLTTPRESPSQQKWIHSFFLKCKRKSSITGFWEPVDKWSHLLNLGWRILKHIPTVVKDDSGYIALGGNQRADLNFGWLCQFPYLLLAGFPNPTILHPSLHLSGSALWENLPKTN